MRKFLLALVFSLASLPVLAQCPGGFCPSPGGNFGGGQIVPKPFEFDPNPPLVDIIPTDLQQKIERASVVVYTSMGIRGNGHQYAKGSGTIVQVLDSVAIITAGHVIRDGQPAYIELPEGKQISYRVVYADYETDFAILEPQSDQEMLYERGVQVFSGVMETRDTYYLSGFGSSKSRLRIWLGRFRRAFILKHKETGDWLEFDRPAMPGDSGGGVFTRDGRLIGIVWGTDGSSTLATYIAPVSMYLRANPTCFLWKRRQPTPPRNPARPPQTTPNPTPPVTPGEGEKPRVEPPTPSQPPVQNPPVQEPPAQKPEVKEQHSFWKDVIIGVGVGLIAFAVYLIVVGLIVGYKFFKSV